MNKSKTPVLIVKHLQKSPLEKNPKQKQRKRTVIYYHIHKSVKMVCKSLEKYLFSEAIHRIFPQMALERNIIFLVIMYFNNFLTVSGLNKFPPLTFNPSTHSYWFYFGNCSCCMLEVPRWSSTINLCMID